MKISKTLILLGICLLSSEALSKSSDQLVKTTTDLNGDGIADTISFKKINTTIGLKIRAGKIVEIEVHKNVSKTSVQLQYALNKNSLALIYGFATNDKIFNSDSDCPMKLSHNEATNDFDEISDQIGAASLKFDQSCDTNPQLKASIQSEIEKFSGVEQDAYSACIADFSPVASAKWKGIPNSLEDTTFGCTSTSTPSGTFNFETNTVEISNYCLATPKTLTQTSREEILHSFGIEQECVAKAIAEACPSKQDLQTSVDKICGKGNVLLGPSKNQDGGVSRIALGEIPVGSQLQTKGINAVASPTYNNNKIISVPREIAAAQVPQPSISDLRTTRSVSTSYEPANTNSFGSRMMALAENTILPQKAFADTLPTPRLAKTNSASPSRLPAEALNSPTMAPSPKASGITYNGVRLKTTETEPTRDVSQNSALKSKSTELASTKTTGRSGVKGNSAPIIAGGAVPRAPASTGSTSSSAPSAAVGSAPSFANLSRDEMLRVLETPALYPDFRQNLNDSNFVEALRKNSITIIDGRGNKLGAPKGQVIFGDTGKRLIKNTRR